MKTNLFLTAALSLSFCLASTAQTLPAYLPADGLVGWWPFNGNANDESGNGNDGVVNGATLTTDRFENTQNAYSFNGAGDHILISNSTSLNPEALTISCWALFNSGNSALLSKVDSLTSTNFGYNLIHDFQNMNNGLYTSWNTDGLCNSSSVHISTFGPSGIINNGIWQFITVTIDEFGFCRQFVNGSMTYGFQGQPLNSCNADESLLYFGKQWFGDPTWMNGKLDDIGIWGRALTDNEIQILYTANSPTFAASCAPLPSNLQNGLVGYWPFCGNANDESGNGNNGTVNGATLTEDRFGVADAAYDFDGVDDLIDIGNASSINSISLDFSISYWINLNSPSTNSMVIASFASGLGGAGWRFHSAIRGDSVDSRFMRSDIINWEINTTPQSSIVQNQWLNIVVVRNDNIFQTYINNDLASTKQVSGIEINSPTVEALTKIGVNWPSSTEYLNGMVDDIGIWNRALTPEEVQQLYTLNACTFTIYDTVTIENVVTVYDTVLTTVTDTLIINTLITELAPPANANTIKVFPNPAGSTLTIDYGNFAFMTGYQLRIENSLGQQVFQTNISQQSDTLSLGTWGGNGLYFVHIVDPQGNTVDIRKIVLQ
jgi:hypothetical protein